MPASPTVVHRFGGEVRLTRADHQSGTDRLAEVAATLDCDIVVNVQGDEPLIDPGAIGEAVAPFAADPSLQMTTLYRRIDRSGRAEQSRTSSRSSWIAAGLRCISRARRFPTRATRGADGRRSIDISASTRIAAARCWSWPRSSRRRSNGPKRSSSCARSSTASASRPSKRRTTRSASTRRKISNKCGD